MSETILCNLGKTPKIFSYLDNGYYNQVTFKLQEDITEKQLKEFFSKVYSMKLDSGFSNSFSKNYNTSDLIKCFTKILISEKFLDLKELYVLIQKKTQKDYQNILPVEYAIDEFFSMFEITEEHSYTEEEYNTMIRQYAMNPFFRGKDPSFEQETKLIDENSRIISIAKKNISTTKFIKIRRKSRKSNLS